jgi:hypothetical protein
MIEFIEEIASNIQTLKTLDRLAYQSVLATNHQPKRRSPLGANVIL